MISTFISMILVVKTKSLNDFVVSENPETRALLFDELMECDSFLCQRLTEIRRDDDVLSVNQFQNADLVLQVG